MIRILLVLSLLLTGCTTTSVQVQTATPIPDQTIATITNQNGKLLIYQDKKADTLEVHFGRDLPKVTATKFSIWKLDGFKLPSKPNWYEGEFGGCCRTQEPWQNWEVLKFHESKFQDQPGIYLIRTEGRVNSWDNEGGQPDDIYIDHYIQSFGNGYWIHRWDLDESDAHVDLKKSGQWLTSNLKHDGNFLITNIDLSSQHQWNMLYTYYSCGKFASTNWIEQGRFIIPFETKQYFPDWKNNNKWTIDFWWPDTHGPIPPGSKPGTSSKC